MARHGNGEGWGGPANGEGWGGCANGAGWGGPAKGAHRAKLRNLPQRGDARLSDVRIEFSELPEAEQQARVERWRAISAAIEARRARLRAYRGAVIWGGPRPRPAFICRYSPGQEKPRR